MWRPGPIHFHQHALFTIRSPGSRWASTWWRSARCWRWPTWCSARWRHPQLPCPDPRRAAADLVRAHGSDTLLVLQAARRQALLLLRRRAGLRGLSDRERRAAAVRRSGRPRRLAAPAAGAAAGFRRGPRTEARSVGASERLCPLYEELGLRTIYLGDEAILELARFSLEGRAIRKVRQSVSRLSKAGYTAELHEVRALDAETAEAGRAGAGARARGRARARLLDGHGLAAGPITTATRWCSWPATRRARCAASFTSSPATGARRCRCRSCAVIPARPTG